MVPIVIHFLSIPFGKFLTSGEVKDWLGFFGNYSGGFLGVVIAFVIARKQAVEQKEILKQQLDLQKSQELAKEARNLKVIQAPALLQIQYEMGCMLKELDKAYELRSFSINTYEGYIKNRVEREELTLEEKEEARKEVEEGTIGMKQLNSQVFSHLQSIDSLELQIKLIDCFTFYDEFSNAVSYDEEKAYKEFQKLKKELDENDKQNFRALYFDYADEKNRRNLKKIYAWSVFESEHKIESFREALQEIEKEIKEIRQIKKVYKKVSEEN
ncbi:hypothetical protein LAV80_21075 [Bacillus wiedmannii]